MSTNEDLVFKRCYVKLVALLPMEDSLFLAKLFSCDLFPGDLKNQIKVQETSIGKATYFLDHVIGPYLSVGNSKNFHKLLSIMEESDNDSLKVLAKEIRVALKERQVSNDTTGCCNISTYVL